ncbi:hypothetical protein ACCP16_14205 [Xanthomonas citri pv. malvacearum]|uniref:hypothetical protein n=1 Tax=Xanthomonas TaxID=338 RepID=UPI000F785B35|nr:hypothetical protein [Xanthomonas citri]
MTGFEAIAMPQNFDIKPGVRIGGELENKISDLADKYYDSTGKKLTVTDGPRTPEDQAARMRYKIEAGEGVKLYRDRGAANEIMNAYRNSDGDPNAAMTQVISNQVARGIYISSHLRDNAADFRKAGVDDKAFREAAGDSKVLNESQPPHYHVEF